MTERSVPSILYSEAVPTILIVEDDPDILETLDTYVRAQGHRSERAGSGERALELLRAAAPDAVVLDIGLPGISGMEVLRRLRGLDGALGRTPVIMLTARVEEVDELLALGLGADDYLTKPFSPRRLLARLDAVLRRAGTDAPPAELLKVGPLSIDLGAVVARLDGQALPLTPGEFRLLHELARQRGRTVGRAELLEAAMPESDALERAIDVHMKNLRRKLEQAGGGELIQTVRGFGYRLDSPA